MIYGQWLTGSSSKYNFLFVCHKLELKVLSFGGRSLEGAVIGETNKHVTVSCYELTSVNLSYTLYWVIHLCWTRLFSCWYIDFLCIPIDYFFIMISIKKIITGVRSCFYIVKIVLPPSFAWIMFFSYLKQLYCLSLQFNFVVLVCFYFGSKLHTPECCHRLLALARAVCHYTSLT